ncbi:MAG: asparagine synthase (glutamine-hydrolyzing) [Candidatus Taylorbacteria bacterium]|nr:asparagine synthase (glutamine-hydrolyzing) [Candidatus Taylorbacteria bacterium]
MCGIIGIVTKNSRNYKDSLDKAILSLKHRGPDADGTHFFDNCALGHTRLSIVDLSTGAQPMLSGDNKFAITFNGEIYGYKEIKKELNNYNFKTTSDTEVILALYEKYGENMMNKLPGMFSFAIWDDNKQSLFCARDRFGEKPFYYCLGKNNELILASEIKALVATGLIQPILDKDSLIDYLKHLYINPNKTIYKNIFTLPPAHFMTFKDGIINVKKYWNLPETNEKISLTEAKKTFKDLLEKAVSKQLIADVSVGAFLSGGLDSSTIVDVASKLKPNLQTFSFGFGESINELPFAKLVAQKYNTQHLELQSGEYDLANLFVEMQEIYDEPFADSSNIPTYLISKAAKKFNKVVLTGDGGDEFFGGYTSWYKPIYYMSQNIIFQIFNIIKSIIVLIFKPSRENKVDLYYRVKGFTNKILFRNPLDIHIKKNTYFSDSELNKILINKNIKNKKEKKSSLNDVIRFDILNYMPGDILTKIDRASMSNGLELRSPFLDVDFASFCISLPNRLKINNKEDKVILRETFSSEWPEEIRKRSKQGFGAPIKEWLELPSFTLLKEKYLNDPKQRIFEIIDFNQTQKIANKNNYQTWILLTLSVWIEKHNFEIV